MTAALRIEGLVKRYRRGLLGRADPVPAVDGVDLEVAPGEVLALVGESGSGKTTLARCALALLSRDAGRIEVLGQDPAALRGAALDRFRARVQPLFQDADAHLNPGLRVREIVEETARLHRGGEPAGPLVEAALAQVGLAHRAAAWPHQLSGGERRRVGIARLLLCRPELVIADEPTAGLDAARRAEVMELILAGEPGRATLLISHDLPLVAAVADRVAVMLGGRIVERLPARALGRGAHHPYTAELLGAAGLLPAAAAHREGRAVGAGAVGCPYAGRCPREEPACRSTRPPERAIGDGGHHVACHLPSLDPVDGLDRGGAPSEPPR